MGVGDPSLDEGITETGSGRVDCSLLRDDEDVEYDKELFDDGRGTCSKRFPNAYVAAARKFVSSSSCWSEMRHS